MCLIFINIFSSILYCHHPSNTLTVGLPSTSCIHIFLGQSLYFFPVGSHLQHCFLSIFWFVIFKCKLLKLICFNKLQILAKKCSFHLADLLKKLISAVQNSKLNFYFKFHISVSYVIKFLTTVLMYNLNYYFVKKLLVP